MGGSGSGARFADKPHAANLMPGTPIGTRALEAALYRLGEWVAIHGLDAPGGWSAARRLLTRNPVEPVGRLEGSFLAIQGPPGSGKTTRAAAEVSDLVAAGKQVGVMGPSHAVIGNLLDAIASEAHERGQPIRIAQKCEAEDVCDAAAETRITTNQQAAGLLAAEALDVVGGTAWLWASEHLDGLVDVLVVDETGQVPLANVLAASSANRRADPGGGPAAARPPGEGHAPGRGGGLRPGAPAGR